MQLTLRRCDEEIKNNKKKHTNSLCPDFRDDSGR